MWPGISGIRSRDYFGLISEYANFKSSEVLPRCRFIVDGSTEYSVRDLHIPGCKNRYSIHARLSVSVYIFSGVAVFGVFQIFY